jgi:lysozyme family protein
MGEKRVLIVDDKDVGFMVFLMKSQGATVTTRDNNDGTWTVKGEYPDKEAAAAHAQIVQPAPLATSTAEAAQPAYTATLETISKPLPEKPFADLAAEYRRNYDLFTIKPGHDSEIDIRVAKLQSNKDRYGVVADKTRVPWQFIAILHMMESNANFTTHLHNGDPLDARTVRVPAGRPVEGHPPFSWEESAFDALEYEGFTGKSDWNIATMLYRFERFNGMGYRAHGVYSPYLWSYTNLYDKGRFVGDHKYDADSVSKQCGAAILLKRLLA